MKKQKYIGYAVVLAALLLVPALVAVAGSLRSKDFSCTVTGSSGASHTNSKAYTVRGKIDSIYVDLTAGCTALVTVVDDYGIIFSNSSISADAQYFPRRAGQDINGSALGATTITKLADGTTGTNTTTGQPLSVLIFLSASVIQSQPAHSNRD